MPKHSFHFNIRQFANLLLAGVLLLLTSCTAAAVSPTQVAEPVTMTLSPVPSETIQPTLTATRTKQPPIRLPTRTPSPSPTQDSSWFREKVDPHLLPIAENYPHFGFSTSASPLTETIMFRVLGLTCVWEDRISSDPFYNNPFRFEIWNFYWEHSEVQGTHEAYQALIDGQVDIILVARAPSEDELTYAGEKGVQFDVQPVALDAFVFIVNTGNPVYALTMEQIRDIYSGKITNWKDVGGTDSEIHAYQRDENSGSQELMQTMVMKDLPLIRADEWVTYTMEGPFNAIGDFHNMQPGDVQGIGYSVFYYAENMTIHENVRYLGVNGVFPSSDNIQNGTYPLISEVYVVVRAGTAPDDPAILMRDWLLTEDGQKTVADSKYVPIH